MAVESLGTDGLAHGHGLQVGSAFEGNGLHEWFEDCACGLKTKPQKFLRGSFVSYFEDFFVGLRVVGLRVVGLRVVGLRVVGLRVVGL